MATKNELSAELEKAKDELCALGEVVETWRHDRLRDAAMESLELVAQSLRYFKEEPDLSLGEMHENLLEAMNALATALYNTQIN